MSLMILAIKVYTFFKKKEDSYPGPGPPLMRSNTWAGFNNCLNLLRNLIPWLSPDLLLTNTKSGLQPTGLTASHASSLPVSSVEKKEFIFICSKQFIEVKCIEHFSKLPMLCNAVGGTTLNLAGPKRHFMLIEGLHAVCTVALHHKHLQSCNLLGKFF